MNVVATSMVLLDVQQNWWIKLNAMYHCDN